VLKLAVLADDLTGGMIIASKLEESGVVCPLVTDVSQLADMATPPTALVLARKIRFIPAQAAQEEARCAAEAFKRLGAATIYYKYSALFDSTDAGNIGPVAESLLDATGATRTLFCPAYIDRGVTVYKGHLFVHSTLASDTYKRFDPVSPALTSDVVTRLRAQTGRKVDLLDHQMLADDAPGRDAFADKAACPFWVADAIDAADVARIASIARDWALVTGGDSLPPAIIMEHRGDAPRERGSGSRLLAGTPGHEAVLAGSCGQNTIQQLDAFAERHPVWRIDLARDGDNGTLVKEIGDWAAAHLPGGPIAVATTADPDGVAAAQARYGREGASMRADRLMAAVAVALRGLGVRKFAIAGGETSGAILTALGARRLEVAGYDQQLYGGYCLNREDIPTSFVLKPGGMGADDFFFSALERMRAAERDAIAA